MRLNPSEALRNALQQRARNSGRPGCRSTALARPSALVRPSALARRAADGRRAPVTRLLSCQVVDMAAISGEPHTSTGAQVHTGYLLVQLDRLPVARSISGFEVWCYVSATDCTGDKSINQEVLRPFQALANVTVCLLLIGKCSALRRPRHYGRFGYNTGDLQLCIWFAFVLQDTSAGHLNSVLCTPLVTSQFTLTWQAHTSLRATSRLVPVSGSLALVAYARA